MSEPLLLIDQLLAKVRHLEMLGCRQEAQTLLTRLIRFRNLPEPVALEMRIRLARLFLRDRRFGAARPHLTAALSLQPRHAYVHFLLARAGKFRGNDDLDRAAGHMRHAVEGAPRRPHFWVVYGQLLFKQGKLGKALTSLRRALELAPDNVSILARVVRALVRAEQFQTARQTIQAALFRNPRCPIVAKLWNKVRFQEARDLQERQRRHRAEGLARKEGPTLLPFENSRPTSSEGKPVRFDGPASLPAPHFPRSFRFSSQKHA